MMKSNSAETRPRRFQFGLKAILGLTLLVSVFFAGRLSMLPRMQKMQAEIHQVRAMADTHMVEVARAQENMRMVTKQYEEMSKLMIGDELITGDERLDSAKENSREKPKER